MMNNTNHELIPMATPEFQGIDLKTMFVLIWGYPSGKGRAPFSMGPFPMASIRVVILKEECEVISLNFLEGERDGSTPSPSKATKCAWERGSGGMG